MYTEGHGCLSGRGRSRHIAWPNFPSNSLFLSFPRCLSLLLSLSLSNRQRGGRWRGWRVTFDPENTADKSGATSLAECDREPAAALTLQGTGWLRCHPPFPPLAVASVTLRDTPGAHDCRSSPARRTARLPSNLCPRPWFSRPISLLIPCKIKVCCVIVSRVISSPERKGHGKY